MSNNSKQQYTTHRYPCLDMYPAGKKFMTNNDFLKIATQQLHQQGLKGKLQASAKKKEMKKLKAAFKIDSIWKKDTLYIHFMDGTDKQKNWVKSVISSKLEPICNKIKFVWDADKQISDIRVSFATPGQAYSYIGSDALQIPIDSHTMNLGWIDDDTQYDTEAYKNTGHVVLHEFGHAMGMVHEHQNPKNNPIVWNKEVVIEWLRRTNGWDDQTIENNMFKKYGDYELCQQAKAMPDSLEKQDRIQNFCEGEVVNGSVYDPKSIMHYFFPKEWIQEGSAEIPVNVDLSDLDIQWLMKYYNTSGDGGKSDTTESTSDTGTTNGGGNKITDYTTNINSAIQSLLNSIHTLWDQHGNIYLFIYIMLILIGVMYLFYKKN